MKAEELHMHLDNWIAEGVITTDTVVYVRIQGIQQDRELPVTKILGQNSCIVIVIDDRPVL